MTEYSLKPLALLMVCWNILNNQPSEGFIAFLDFPSVKYSQPPMDELFCGEFLQLTASSHKPVGVNGSTPLPPRVPKTFRLEG